MHVEPYVDSNQIHYFYYELEAANNKAGALRIDKNTGEIWIGPNFTVVEDTTTFLVNVKSELNAVLARISVILSPLEPANVEEFCEKYTSKLCFFDTVLYNIPENNRVMEEVGVLGPAAYKRLCPRAKIDYVMMNGKFISKVLKSLNLQTLINFQAPITSQSSTTHFSPKMP